jgi:hypothetical protein
LEFPMASQLELVCDRGCVRSLRCVRHSFEMGA